MNQILKRLEIIKSSIAIAEDEIIELQMMKLEKLDVDEDVKHILKHLESFCYGDAVSEIDSYLKKYSGVVGYVDVELQSLKLELKALESELQELSQQKQESLNDIDEFNTMYSLRLGDSLMTFKGSIQNSVSA